MSPPLKVAVNGAGVAGLATARALKTQNHQIVVYEKSSQLGGTWVYEPRVESDPLSLDPDRESVHGSLYHSLRTNLPRQLMGFSDYPFPTSKNGDPITFPGHVGVLEFLNEFAVEFGLTELIRFETEVVRVKQGDSRNDKWVVESRSVGTSESNSVEKFDAVVVCNGHHTQPRLADFKGIEKWPGKQVHSHNYRIPRPFKDKIVVVIGEGASAIDISVEISKVAKEVHLSSRSSNIQITKLDCADNMWQHSKIDYVDENGEVGFHEGASIHADIILHCTGYKYDFPFLKTEGIVGVDDNRVGPLYKQTFTPTLAPNLSFVGLTYRSAIFLTIDLQAKWVAHVLSGNAALPSVEEMLADVQEHYRRMEEEGIPKHHTHSVDHEFGYLDWLANQVGLAGIDDRIKLIYRNYYKFVAEKSARRAREWEPTIEM